MEFTDAAPAHESEPMYDSPEAVPSSPAKPGSRERAAPRSASATAGRVSKSVNREDPAARTGVVRGNKATAAEDVKSRRVSKVIRVDPAARTGVSKEKTVRPSPYRGRRRVTSPIVTVRPSSPPSRPTAEEAEHAGKQRLDSEKAENRVRGSKGKTVRSSPYRWWRRPVAVQKKAEQRRLAGEQRLDSENEAVPDSAPTSAPALDLGVGEGGENVAVRPSEEAEHRRLAGELDSENEAVPASTPTSVPVVVAATAPTAESYRDEEATPPSRNRSRVDRSRSRSRSREETEAGTRRAAARREKEEREREKAKAAVAADRKKQEAIALETQPTLLPSITVPTATKKTVKSLKGLPKSSKPGLSDERKIDSIRQNNRDRGAQRTRITRDVNISQRRNITEDGDAISTEETEDTQNYLAEATSAVETTEETEDTRNLAAAASKTAEKEDAAVRPSSPSLPPATAQPPAEEAEHRRLAGEQRLDSENAESEAVPAASTPTSTPALDLGVGEGPLSTQPSAEEAEHRRLVGEQRPDSENEAVPASTPTSALDLGVGEGPLPVAATAESYRDEETAENVGVSSGSLLPRDESEAESEAGVRRAEAAAREEREREKAKQEAELAAHRKKQEIALETLLPSTATKKKTVTSLKGLPKSSKPGLSNERKIDSIRQNIRDRDTERTRITRDVNISQRRNITKDGDAISSSAMETETEDTQSYLAEATTEDGDAMETTEETEVHKLTAAAADASKTAEKEDGEQRLDSEKADSEAVLASTSVPAVAPATAESHRDADVDGSLLHHSNQSRYGEDESEAGARRAEAAREREKAKEEAAAIQPAPTLLPSITNSDSEAVPASTSVPAVAPATADESHRDEEKNVDGSLLPNTTPHSNQAKEEAAAIQPAVPASTSVPAVAPATPHSNQSRYEEDESEAGARRAEAAREREKAKEEAADRKKLTLETLLPVPTATKKTVKSSSLKGLPRSSKPGLSDERKIDSIRQNNRDRGAERTRITRDVNISQRRNITEDGDAISSAMETETEDTENYLAEATTEDGDAISSATETTTEDTHRNLAAAAADVSKTAEKEDAAVRPSSPPLPPSTTQRSAEAAHRRLAGEQRLDSEKAESEAVPASSVPAVAPATAGDKEEVLENVGLSILPTTTPHFNQSRYEEDESEVRRAEAAARREREERQREKAKEEAAVFQAAAAAADSEILGAFDVLEYIDNETEELLQNYRRGLADRDEYIRVLENSNKELRSINYKTDVADVEMSLDAPTDVAMERIMDGFKKQVETIGADIKMALRTTGEIDLLENMREYEEYTINSLKTIYESTLIEFFNVWRRLSESEMRRDIEDDDNAKEIETRLKEILNLLRGTFVKNSLAKLGLEASVLFDDQRLEVEDIPENAEMRVQIVTSSTIVLPSDLTDRYSFYRFRQTTAFALLNYIVFTIRPALDDTRRSLDAAISAYIKKTEADIAKMDTRLSRLDTTMTNKILPLMVDVKDLDKHSAEYLLSYSKITEYTKTIVHGLNRILNNSMFKNRSLYASLLNKLHANAEAYTDETENPVHVRQTAVLLADAASNLDAVLESLYETSMAAEATLFNSSKDIVVAQNSRNVAAVSATTGETVTETEGGGEAIGGGDKSRKSGGGGGKGGEEEEDDDDCIRRAAEAVAETYKVYMTGLISGWEKTFEATTIGEGPTLPPEEKLKVLEEGYQWLMSSGYETITHEQIALVRKFNDKIREMCKQRPRRLVSFMSNYTNILGSAQVHINKLFTDLLAKYRTYITLYAQTTESLKKAAAAAKKAKEKQGDDMELDELADKRTQERADLAAAITWTWQAVNLNQSVSPANTDREIRVSLENGKHKVNMHKIDLSTEASLQQDQSWDGVDPAESWADFESERTAIEAALDEMNKALVSSASGSDYSKKSVKPHGLNMQGYPFYLLRICAEKSDKTTSTTVTHPEYFRVLINQLKTHDDKEGRLRLLGVSLSNSLSASEIHTSSPTADTANGLNATIFNIFMVDAQTLRDISGTAYLFRRFLIEKMSGQPINDGRVRAKMCEATVASLFTACRRLLRSKQLAGKIEPMLEEELAAVTAIDNSGSTSDQFRAKACFLILNFLTAYVKICLGRVVCAIRVLRATGLHSKKVAAADASVAGSRRLAVYDVKYDFTVLYKLLCLQRKNVELLLDMGFKAWESCVVCVAAFTSVPNLPVSDDKQRPLFPLSGDETVVASRTPEENETDAVHDAWNTIAANDLMQLLVQYHMWFKRYNAGLGNNIDALIRVCRAAAGTVYACCEILSVKLPGTVARLLDLFKNADSTAEQYKSSGTQMIMDAEWILRGELESRKTSLNTKNTGEYGNNVLGAWAIKPGKLTAAAHVFVRGFVNHVNLREEDYLWGAALPFSPDGRGTVVEGWLQNYVLSEKLEDFSNIDLASNSPETGFMIPPDPMMHTFWNSPGGSSSGGEVGKKGYVLRRGNVAVDLQQTVAASNVYRGLLPLHSVSAPDGSVLHYIKPSRGVTILVSGSSKEEIARKNMLLTNALEENRRHMSFTRPVFDIEHQRNVHYETPRAILEGTGQHNPRLGHFWVPNNMSVRASDWNLPSLDLLYHELKQNDDANGGNEPSSDESERLPLIINRAIGEIQQNGSGGGVGTGAGRTDAGGSHNTNLAIRTVVENIMSSTADAAVSTTSSSNDIDRVLMPPKVAAAASLRRYGAGGAFAPNRNKARGIYSNLKRPTTGLMDGEKTESWWTIDKDLTKKAALAGQTLIVITPAILDSRGY